MTKSEFLAVLGEGRKALSWPAAGFEVSFKVGTCYDSSRSQRRGPRFQYERQLNDAISLAFHELCRKATVISQYP